MSSDGAENARLSAPRWIIDPSEETLAVHRWGPDGYIEILAAQRGEVVRAEPYDAVELHVGG